MFSSVYLFVFPPDSPGLWKIRATYFNDLKLSCSEDFEVKEYGKHQYQTSRGHFSPQTDDFHFHTLQWCPACLYN